MLASAGMAKSRTTIGDRRRRRVHRAASAISSLSACDACACARRVSVCVYVCAWMRVLVCIFSAVTCLHGRSLAHISRFRNRNRATVQRSLMRCAPASLTGVFCALTFASAERAYCAAQCWRDNVQPPSCLCVRNVQAHGGRTMCVCVCASSRACATRDREMRVCSRSACVYVHEHRATVHR